MMDRGMSSLGTQESIWASQTPTARAAAFQGWIMADSGAKESEIRKKVSPLGQKLARHTPDEVELLCAQGNHGYSLACTAGSTAGQGYW
jgi:hypothetical protein